MTADELIKVLEELNQANLERLQPIFDRIQADRQPLIDFLETLHATDKHSASLLAQERENRVFKNAIQPGRTRSS